MFEVLKAIFTEAEIEYKIAVLELIIDGVVVAGIWQILSGIAGKKQEKHLEKKLDNLYDRIIETREEAKKSK